MVTSGYTLDLYCDCSECKACSWSMQSYHPKCGHMTYTGETWGECASEARKDGWQIGRDRITCYAPGHKRS